ncbi:glycoside hydrolase family 13 protein [Trichoderma novae-zelandiae]
MRENVWALDYIASLGVDVVWICPVYDSPQVDTGYDIPNYEDIEPPYGTLQDMETLIREAHARGMKIMPDLVINHTSYQYPWFQESRASKDNSKRDWYIWRPVMYSCTSQYLPPNNWRCKFGGGGVWEWDEQSGEYYLHLFAKEQPDLKWENPVTRKAMYASAMEIWLERGVDGRLPYRHGQMYSKPPGVPDAPELDPGAPYQMNQVLAKYGAITVGELPSTPDRARVLQYVSAEAKQLDMGFQFDVVNVGFNKPLRYDARPKDWQLPDRLYIDFVREHRSGEGMGKALASLAHFARDHARVPMEAEESGKEVKGPWMKPHPLAGVLAYWRKAVLFRKEYADLLVYGDFRTLREEDGEIYTFVKEPPSGGSAKAVVALNFTGEEKSGADPMEGRGKLRFLWGMFRIGIAPLIV